MGSSIRRTDLLELSNLRNDGRKPMEIRRMRIQMGCIGGKEGIGGSALVEMGLTVALATVKGPIACQRRADELPDRAIVDVSIKATPFAPVSQDRRLVNPNTDRRLIEISHLLKRALEATILLQLYPKSRMQIQVVILADDGGRLCAAINAASVALVDAGIPIKDILCSCSAGYSQSATSSETTLIDLNKHEESSYQGGQNAVSMPCAILPQRGTIVLAQCEARIPDLKAMDSILNAAMDGCRAVFDIIQATMRERASTLLSSRNGHGTIMNSFTNHNNDNTHD